MTSNDTTRRKPKQLASLLLILIVSSCMSGAERISHTELPIRADSFVDSMGINIHLHNGDTPYGNFAIVAPALRDLGIRHTRDGLIPTTWQEYYRRHAELASSGMHCDFITGPDLTNEQILTFLTKVPGVTESLEGPNEYDQADDHSWAPKLAAFMPRLHTLALQLPGVPIKVIGPSLIGPNASQQVPNLAASFSASNMHNYFGGRNPGTPGWGENGYGSIDWNLAMAEQAWGKKPAVTTETGYLTDLSQDQSVGEALQAVYTPRIFLEQWLHGIRRTYLYELSDGYKNASKNDGSFGIIRGDGSRKPAFISLQRLVRLFADPGPAFIPQPVRLTFGEAPTELHHLLLQKRNGKRYLAFWLESSSMDQQTRKSIAVPPVVFKLSVKDGLRSARLISLDPAQSAEGSLLKLDHPGQVTLTARDFVSVLEF